MGTDPVGLLLRANPYGSDQTMNTLILLVDAKSQWSPELWVIQQGGNSLENGQVMLERPKGWLSVTRNDEVIQDYDEFEIRILEDMLVQPIPFLVEWKGSELVGMLLQAVPSDCNAVIDNDHGVISPVIAVRDLSLESWIAAQRLIKSFAR